MEHTSHMTDSREAVHELARQARTGTKMIGEMRYPCAVDGKLVSDMLLRLMDRATQAESQAAHANEIFHKMSAQLVECSHNLDTASRLIHQLQMVLAALVNANGSTKNYRYYEPEAQAAVAALADITRWDDAE